MLFCVILTCCWVCKLIMCDSQLNPGRNMDLFLPSVYFSKSSFVIKMEKNLLNDDVSSYFWQFVADVVKINVRWFWLNLQILTSFTHCRTLLTACVCFKGVFHRVWAAAEGATDSPVSITEEEGGGGGWPAFWITSAGPSVNASTGARGGMPWPLSWPEFWLVWGREGRSLFEIRR